MFREFMLKHNLFSSLSLSFCGFFKTQFDVKNRQEAHRDEEQEEVNKNANRNESEMQHY